MTVQRRAAATVMFAAALFLFSPAHAQTAATVLGRVVEVNGGPAIAAATVSVEGTSLRALTDSAGVYRLESVPAGPHVLVTEALGYATARVPVSVPARGLVRRDVELATNALQLPTLTVTAEVVGRARGELGTASVIGREAIAARSATSLAGVLELVPGVEMRPPGLDGVQQFGLRTVQTSRAGTVTLGDPSAADLASAGTLIVLDGVPLSNNANLQTTGPRGEVALPSSARGGVDLRRIPAATLERVEVIRGIPSARYGDLTQGVVVVDTRAGAFDPEARGLFDPHSGAGTLAGGWRIGGVQAVAGNVDVTRTGVDTGLGEEEVMRVSAQASHRAARFGAGASSPRLTLDTRVDYFQVYADHPENLDVAPGFEAYNRDRGVRFSERARLATGADSRLELTASVEYVGQRSMRRVMRSRGGTPFTDRVAEGRALGRYIGGQYPARLDVEGDAWQLYTRLEHDRPLRMLGSEHSLRAGAELRREWNAGPGYQFDIEFPMQVSFNGVQGFDRPRRFDAVPAVATTSLYLDDRFLSVLPGGIPLELQLGVRADLLHEGTHWFSGARDAVLQPRLNAQLAPWPWLRLRAGAGRVAKQPTLGDLYPAPQYFDVINVNWFADDPVERLAVLTTFIRDPSNADLGYARARKLEAGFELATSDGNASLAVTAFRDRTDGAIAYRPHVEFLLRDRYALRDSVIGDARPTEFLDPPTHADTVPIRLDVPSNLQTLRSAGWEGTLRLPEFRPLRTRLEVQTALIDTDLRKAGVDLGPHFGDFQMNERIPRTPYWDNVGRQGELGLATYRLIHHQPQLGIVLAAAVQHYFHEKRRNLGAGDNLAWAGYVTRTGEFVPVPAERRSDPEFADLRLTRSVLGPTTVANDWFLSLQATMRLPADARISFYAFNALARPGQSSSGQRALRSLPRMRFGAEGTLPLRAFRRGPAERADER